MPRSGRLVPVVLAALVPLLAACQEVSAAGGPACREVTFTPRGAATPQAGELCLPRPAEGRRVPAVVLVHGGGAVKGDRTWMRGWVEHYSAAGVPTLNITYTLLGRDDAGPLYPLPEAQVKGAVEYLRSRAGRLGVDPGRIVLHGNSNGARLGGQALVTPDDPFFRVDGDRAGVRDAPDAFVGLYGLYDGTLTETDLENRYFGGPPDSTDPAVVERRRRADTIAQAGAATGPALLVHGTRDVDVDPSQSVRLDEALRAAGGRSDLLLVPGVDHSFDRTGTREARRTGRRPNDLTADGESVAQAVLAWVLRRPLPSADLRRRRAAVRAGRAELPVRCWRPADTACRGRVTLRRGRVTLGRATFVVPGSSVRTVRVRLRATGAVARGQRRRVAAEVRTAGPVRLPLVLSGR